MHARAENPDATVLSPRLEPVAETRQRIIDACGRMLDLLGYRRFRMEDVAAAAGLSRQSLINYFPKKDDLVWATTEDRMRTFETVLVARVASFDDPVEGLRVALRENLETLGAMPGTRPPLLDDMIEYLAGKGASLVVDQFHRTGKALAGIFDADPTGADIAGEALVRLVLSFLMFDEGQRNPDRAATVIASTVAGIVAPGRMQIPGVSDIAMPDKRGVST